MGLGHPCSPLCPLSWDQCPPMHSRPGTVNELNSPASSSRVRSILLPVPLPQVSARSNLALELSQGADHCAAEKERAQEGRVCRLAKPLGLHLGQQLPEILFPAFHISRKRQTEGGRGSTLQDRSRPGESKLGSQNPAFKCLQLGPAPGPAENTQGRGPRDPA